MTPGVDAIGNPWLTIWTSPRATIRRIVETDVHYQVTFLAMLAGGLSWLESRWSQPPIASASAAWPMLVVLSVVIGAIVGFIGLYVNGALFKWSGSALGGVATYGEVRAALAWSEVPVIVALSIGILSILVGTGGPALPLGSANAGSSVGVSLLHAVLGVWSFVIALKCVGEVHRFSAWRALASVLLIAAAFIVLIGIAILLPFGLGKLLHPVVTA